MGPENGVTGQAEASGSMAGEGVAPGFAIGHARSLLASAPLLAEQQARAVLAVLPDDARALAIIGAARRRQGDLATARQVLSLVAPRRPEVERAALELALTLAALGEGRDAIEILRGLARVTATPPDWLVVAGEFMLAGEPAETVARAEHLRGLARGPDLLAAVDALRAGRPRDAALMAAGHLRRAPEDAVGLWVMAEADRALGRTAEAERGMARSVAVGKLAGARAVHAAMLLEAGQPGEALRGIASCAPGEQGSDAVQFLVASCHLQMGDADEAARVTASLVALQAGYARLWMLHGAALRAAGREEPARAAVARAASLRPEKGEGWWRIEAARDARA